MPEVKSWSFLDSIETISRTMRRNDVLWTRMSYEQKGALYDLQIVGKAQKTDGILPIKQDSRLSDTAKYGGYRSMSGAYFSLIELASGERKIAYIPIIAKDNRDTFIAKTYGDSTKIIIPKIKYKSLFKINGFPLHLTGRTGNMLLLSSAKQLVVDYANNTTLKGMINVFQKLIIDKSYKISDKDGLSDGSIDSVYETIMRRLDAFKGMPTAGCKINEIIAHKKDFSVLAPTEKIRAVISLLRAYNCSAETGDLSAFVPNASFVGKVQLTSSMHKVDSVRLVIQSATGLFEREIDLKTVQPGEL